MSFSGKNAGYQNRGGKAIAGRTSTVEYDLCECGRKKMVGSYICNTCDKEGRRYIPTATPKLLTHIEVYAAHNTSCYRCPNLADCQRLVVLDAPVMCEIPDELDMRVLASRRVS